MARAKAKQPDKKTSAARKKTVTKLPPGRPTQYSEYLAELICSRIADGESLVAICKSEHIPHRSTVLRWAADNPAFCDKYARAREAQAELLAEEIIEIADDTSGDFKLVVKDGKEEAVYDAEHVQRSKLRVDARKWFASKVAPAKYGDKQTIDLNANVRGTVAYKANIPSRT